MEHNSNIGGYNINSNVEWVQQVNNTNVATGTNTNTTVATNISSNNNISKDKTAKTNKNTF